MSLLKPGRPSQRTDEHVANAKRKISSGGEKRLNVNMGKGEYLRLKRFAAKSDMTISDVVKVALQRYMEQQVEEGSE